MKDQVKVKKVALWVAPALSVLVVGSLVANFSDALVSAVFTLLVLGVIALVQKA